MLPIRTILHAKDMSECSNYTYQLACSLARDYNAKLLLINVVPLQGAAMGAEGMVIPPVAVNIDQLRSELTKLAKDTGICRTGIVLADGDPADEILRVAKENKCDLIAMGTHGRRGLGRLVMGSIAEQVVRRGTCPVLTVKTPEKKAAATSAEQAAATATIPGDGVTA